MYRNVFISFAKEDIKFATQLYDFLQVNNYKPWLDKRKLLPGTNWDFAIRNALDASDFVILLLSSISVSKRGYVQREYKLALKNWETKLDSDIYIIPILIDDCDVPKTLNKFQWVRYDEENVFENILASLDSQRTVYLENAYVEELLDTHYTKSLPLDNSKIPITETSVEFPQFPNNPFFNAEYVNAFIQHDVMNQMSNFLAFTNDEEVYMHLPEHLKKYLYFSSNYEIYSISQSHLSLILYISSYWGGPHPNHRIVTKNFSFNPVKNLKLSDVVKFDNIKDFIVKAYSKYSNDFLKDDGSGVVARIYDEFEQWGANDIDFVFNEDSLKLMSNNLLSHAFQGSGNIDIPLKDLKLNIKI